MNIHRFAHRTSDGKHQQLFSKVNNISWHLNTKSQFNNPILIIFHKIWPKIGIKKICRLSNLWPLLAYSRKYSFCQFMLLKTAYQLASFSLCGFFVLPYSHKQWKSSDHLCVSNIFVSILVCLHFLFTSYDTQIWFNLLI